MSRAIRRHHVERLKAKRKINYYWHVKNVDNPERLLGFYVNTACVCSCFLCKPHKYSGKRPLKERICDEDKNFHIEGID